MARKSLRSCAASDEATDDYSTFLFPGNSASPYVSSLPILYYPIRFGELFREGFVHVVDWDCCTIRDSLIPIVYVPNLQLACPTALLLDFVISACGTARATAATYQEGPKRAFTSA